MVSHQVREYFPQVNLESHFEKAMISSVPTEITAVFEILHTTLPRDIS